MGEDTGRHLLKDTVCNLAAILVDCFFVLPHYPGNAWTGLVLLVLSPMHRSGPTLFLSFRSQPPAFVGPRAGPQSLWLLLRGFAV